MVKLRASCSRFISWLGFIILALRQSRPHRKTVFCFPISSFPFPFLFWEKHLGWFENCQVLDGIVLNVLNFRIKWKHVKNEHPTFYCDMMFSIVEYTEPHGCRKLACCYMDVSLGQRNFYFFFIIVKQTQSLGMVAITLVD